MEEWPTTMEWILKIIILLSPLISVGIQAQSPSLVVTSFPAVLFQTNGGVHNITAGSVIQLYCSVQSTTATFSWTKDGRPVVIDIPHLRERTCNDSTTATSVLTVDNFRSSDDGTYQCMTMRGNDTGEGGSIELRAAINGSLTIIRHPTEDEELLEGGLLSKDNRTGIVLGSQVSINCIAETFNLNNAPHIQISWIRDGNTIVEDSTHYINTIDLNSNLQITDFSLHDIGVYQCIYAETTELITTIPFKLQTDIMDDHEHLNHVTTISLERVSPEVILLRPPEKLVIEIKATGRYRRIVWHKNGFLLPHQFPNYNEILVYGTTTQDDLGLYEVSLFPVNPIQRTVPNELDFLIVPPVDANTTITNGSDISVREGESLTISCISTGTPTPSISWEFNGQPVMFQPMESVMGEQVVITRDPLTNDVIPNIVLGTITSNLLIVNAQYSEYDGVFTCIGSNDNLTINISSAMVNVHILVTTESFFQLRIFPVDDCVSWTERNNDQKQGDIRAHVADVIDSACSCGFSATNITESVFSCRSSETQVVFKARLSYTSPAGTQTAEDLVMLFSSWVSSGPSLTVTGTVLSVDPTCPVELGSLTDEDCLRPNLPMVSDALNVTIIWAGTLGGVLAIAIMIVIVIIVLILVRYSWRTKMLNISRSYELQPVDEKSEAEGTSQEYEVIPAFSEANNPTVQSNIAYGMIQLPKANNPAVVSSIQQQECESRRGDKQTSAMQESIAAANSPQDSGYVNPSTQADGTNEEESTYDEI